MLIVYKGQDTEFANSSPLEVDIGGNLNLEGFSAKIEFFGITKNFSPEVVQTKKLPLSYSAHETRAFFPGLNYADLFLIDKENRIAIYRKIVIDVRMSGDAKVDYIDVDRAVAIIKKLENVARRLKYLSESDDIAEIKSSCNELMEGLRYNGEFWANRCQFLDYDAESLTRKLRKLQELVQSIEPLNEASTVSDIKQLINVIVKNIAQ